MNLFELAAKLTLDSSQYEKGIKAASDSANSIGGKIGGALKTAGKIGVTAFTAITSAAIGMSTALVKSVSDVAAYGDNIDKMSQKMGLSAQAYQEWDAIMQHSGTSMESLKAGMKTLANAVESGNDAFNRLGISQEQIASMNQEDLFAATISALQNVEDETERTYLAGQLLGRGATELGPLLNMTAEETDEMRKRVHELGGVMSDDAVKAAAQFDDNLQDLKTSLSGIKMSLTTGFLPGINDVVAGFTSLIIGEEGAEEQLKTGFDSILTNIDNIIPRIVDVISGLADALVVAAPHIVKAGIALIKGLGKALLDNADVVIDAAFEIINSIVDVISDPDTLSGLVDGAIKIIKKLGDSLSKNIPILLPTIVQMAMDIITMLTSPENMETMMNVAVALLGAIADGLVNSIDIILDEAPGIIDNLVKVLFKVAPKFFKSVFDVFTSYWGRLISLVWEKISGIGESIWGWLQEHVFTPISNFFSDVWNKIVEFFQPLIDTIQPVLDSLGELFSAFGELATAAWELIKEKVGEAVDKVKEKFGEIWDKVSEVATNVWNKITEVFGNLVAPIEQPLQDFYDKVTGVFDDAKDWILGIVADAWNWGHDLIENIISGISSRIGSLTEKVKGVAGTIFSWLHQSTADIGPLKDTDKWGVDLMDNIINGIESKRGELQREVEGVAKSMDFNRAYTFTPTVSGIHNESATGRGDKIDRLINLLETYLPEIGHIELDGEVVANSVDQRLGRIAAQKARV